MILRGIPRGIIENRKVFRWIIGLLIVIRIVTPKLLKLANIAAIQL